MTRLTSPLLGAALLAVGAAARDHRVTTVSPRPLPAPSATVSPAATDTVSAEALNRVVQGLCMLCHNDQARLGNVSLAGFDVAHPERKPDVAEKMIRKLRAGMMPPPGVPRPGGDTLLALVETLERRIDQAAAANPDPGYRTFQRLNREEYRVSVRNLLDLEIDAGEFLPLDTKSANFDNIADVQMPSATLVEGYLRAAAQISRMAVGDPEAGPTSAIYKVPRTASQLERVEGAPIGTRGGVSVIHHFLRAGRGAGRRPLAHGIGPQRHDPDHGLHLPAGRRPARDRGVHPALRGPGGRPDHAGGPHAGGYADRPRVWGHHVAPSPGLGCRGPICHHRRVGDAQPPEDLHLSSDVPRRSSALRREHHRPLGHPGIPAAPPGEGPGRVDAVLRPGRGGRRLRGWGADGAPGHPGQPPFRVPHGSGSPSGGPRRRLPNQRHRPGGAAVLLPVGRRAGPGTHWAGGSPGTLAPRDAGRPGAADARRPAVGSAGHEIRLAVAPAPGPGQGPPRRTELPVLRPDACRGDASRDRAVLRLSGARRPERAGTADRRLHLRQPTPGPALRDGQRHRDRVPQGGLPQPRSAGTAGSRQHPHPDVARRPDLTGPPRQVGDGGAPRHAAPAAAPECARLRVHR
ncbi:MAG: DUF1587 domain-containing protein [Gemmatimonadetes bacterium]|nr:DUF1587 domain-containing protein [Gemmatimonadota bacterium]